MKPLEAKAELYSLIDAVKQYHEGEWEVIDSGALPCATGSGEQGTQFLYTLATDGLDDQQAQANLLDAMTKAWTEAGFAPTQSVRPAYKGIIVTDLTYPAAGSGGGEQGLVLQLSVGPNAVTADGQSRCVPGDPDDINRPK